MAEVRLKNVWKRFGDVVAVNDFSLDIQDREFVVFVGPSGCGKSTTLRMIAGLEDITQGEVYIGNELVNEVEPKDRNIAMVFQNYALYPHMNVYENMAFGLQLRKMPKDQIEKRVKETAAILGLENLLHRRPKELSGGQRQRVALGRAMVREPAAFLMDEPLSNLDAKLRAQMRLEIIKLHQTVNTTTIYVTHDQMEAMTMADRIVVMNQGVIQQVDTPENIYQNPANLFVAGFVGSPAMNFLKAEIRNEGEQVVAVGDHELFEVALPARLITKVRQGDIHQVVIGVRPEDVVAVGESGEGYDSEVDVVEALGAETFAYLKLGGYSITARFAPNYRVSEGDNLRIGFREGRVHFFDAKSEQAL